MEKHGKSRGRELLGSVGYFVRRCLFRIVSVGPVPNHVSFIMDGNRRFAKKERLEEGEGHNAGFLALISILEYCYELGIKYVSIYAFSIENFKRRPDEVQKLMDLLLDKTQSLLKQESLVNQYGVRVYFIGNFKLLSKPVREAAQQVMAATANNTNCTLIICISYTSTDEIVHAVHQSCKAKMEDVDNTQVTAVERNARMLGEECIVKLVDIQKHMYMAVAPDPDILIRTSGETRLSNFLLWQTGCCELYSPTAYWPEIGLWHLVWAVFNFQRHYSYLEKKRKQL